MGAFSNTCQMDLGHGSKSGDQKGLQLEVEVVVEVGA